MSNLKYNKQKHKNPIDEKIGTNLATLRRSKGITQTELAEQIEASQDTISKLEKGEIEFTASRIFKIASALGVSVYLLFGEEQNESKEEQDRKIKELEKELKYLKTINAMLKDRVLYFQQVKAKARIKKITENYEKEQKKLRVKYYKGIKEIFIKFGFDDVSTFFDDKDYHFYENEFEGRYSKSPNYRKFKEENERLKNNLFSEADTLKDEWEETIKRIKKYAEEYLL